MSTASEIADIIGGLTIVSNADGFDVTLSEAQVKKYRDNLFAAVNKKRDGTKSKVRITNLNRVIVPVALKLAWPYVLAVFAAGFFSGKALK